MTLPDHYVYDRTSQELEESIDRYMVQRNIPAHIMELVLYRLLTHVQKIKDYDTANLYIKERQDRETEEQKQKEEQKAEVANE